MRTLGRIIGIGAVAVAALTLTACGSDDTAAATDSSAQSTFGKLPAQNTGAECTADDIEVVGGYGATPKISIPDTCTPPTKLIVKDLVAGSGPAAVAGDPLTMNYSLVTWSNKQKLDSSFDRGKPFTLTLGGGQVIKGWDQGLVGVQQGARRLLIVPPNLGYGKGGNGVQPNETLVFVTDAVKIGK
ncbi:FKBP-type peptidyl-prolyl cis-trans isomerase [Nocardia sp. XZ_19_385]|uniref:FKBP-type peptidyl-prolyl cis-trans isomerase n=1 Tax=Nocardia sp. XZ_19_385 TaxID=2769488 RepID=UPI0018904963|nr:FKBP-type peptidyl-prolyl cis-trans isomerase [Nocardia sp. XZ_19_385]